MEGEGAEAEGEAYDEEGAEGEEGVEGEEQEGEAAEGEEEGKAKGEH